MIPVHKQLEIWAKVQREFARRPKSDWGLIQKVGGKIPPIAKSRGCIQTH